MPIAEDVYSGEVRGYHFQMKTCINAVLENVDISPGRSRVAAVTFASEPTVSFHFDKYYTQESVKGIPYRIRDHIACQLRFLNI